MSLEFQNLAHRPEYVPLVIRWWHSVWHDRMGSDFPSLEKQLRQSLTQQDFPVHMLAVNDDEPVAVAALKLHELEDLFPEKLYWLGSVFVAAEQRGHNLGSQITQCIVDLASERKLPHLYLQTQNLTGGLYTKLGWEPLQTLSVHGEQTLLMIKHLDGTS
ncbi:MAG: GNAT family N-acetyltransferase [Pseudomonadales bacterium]|nr:GNAT family N-acetyltransferase [Pseudomonadales bacterium]